MRVCDFGAARRVTPRTGRACCSLWTMRTAIGRSGANRRWLTASTAIGRSGANRRWLTASVCVCVHLCVRARFEFFFLSLELRAVRCAPHSSPCGSVGAASPPPHASHHTPVAHCLARIKCHHERRGRAQRTGQIRSEWIARECVRVLTRMAPKCQNGSSRPCSRPPNSPEGNSLPGGRVESAPPPPPVFLAGSAQGESRAGPHGRGAPRAARRRQRTAACSSRLRSRPPRLLAPSSHSVLT